MTAPRAGDEKVIRSVCMICRTNYCGILAHVRDGVLAKVEPSDFPNPGYRHICLMGLSTPKMVYHPDRPRYPMKRVGGRGEGKWQRISWGEALDTVAARFKEIAEKYGPHSVGWYNMPMQGILSQSVVRFASATGGTFISTVGPGDAAGMCGDLVSYGTQIGIVHTTGFQKPRLCVIWGENNVETFILVHRAIRDAKESGARVVVIDPRFTPTAAKGDEWVPIRPGTDAALALAMIDVIIKQGLEDKSFLTDCTVGPFLVRGDNGLFLREKDIPGGKPADKYVVWDAGTNTPQAYDRPGSAPALRGSYMVRGIECKPAFQLLVEVAEQYPLSKASEITEIDPDTIKRLALECGNSKPMDSYRGLGLQRTFHGDLAYRAITALAAVTGNIKLAHHAVQQQPFAASFVCPRGPARQLSLLKMYEATLNSNPYPIRALWVSRQNWLNQFPNLNRVIRDILPRLEFIVVADVLMGTSAEYADIVLPLCSFFEYLDLNIPMPTWGGPPYFQLQQKVIEPFYECRSEFEILTRLAPRMGVGEYFNRSAEDFIEMFLPSGGPSGEKVTIESMAKGRLPEAIFTPIKLSTPSQRVEFYSERLRGYGEALPLYKEPLETNRQPRSEKYPLTFLSTHTRFRKHSMLANVDWLREITPEPVLEMNPVDAIKRGIKDGDIVMVFNDRGKMKVKAMVHEGIKPGVINTTEGWWPRHFAEGHHQELSHDAINPAQQAVWEPNVPFYDVSVEVKKAREE